MVKPFQYRRMMALAFLLVTAFCALGYRLVDLQVLRHEILRAKAEDNTRRSFLREPPRGEIRDIRGNLLATSVFVKTVCADPVLIAPFQAEVARTVAPILQLDEAELYERLQLRTRINDQGMVITNRYVVLQRKVRVEEWARVQAAMAQMPLPVDETQLTRTQRVFCQNLRQKSVFADALEDQAREYPNGTLAAHILGHVGMIEREVNGTRLLETTGKDGIELFLNSKLSGVRGWRSTERDSRGRELVAYREQDIEPRAGYNVVLTIDAGLQHIVESELADVMQKHTPVSASAIVVRPRTGEILAMATLPNFDPENPGTVPPEYRRNRVISDIAEPGSTFKIVVVSAALNEGLVSLHDRFDCERGLFYYAGRALKDHGAYDILSVEHIISKSSNIGSAKVGIRLGEQRLHQYVRGFGFGERTGVQLPGEVSGIVHPLKNWSKLSISRIPMGHEVATTPLQMAMAMSAIANEGRLMRPMLVKRLEDDRGRVVAQFHPQAIREVVSSRAAQQMVTALKTAVSKDGTGDKASLEFYTVAGKTGTAQKPGPGGYMPGKYFASFIGFFPADAPELCISIVLDEPKKGYYGGQTAGPVFRNIAERAANYLNVPAEKQPAGLITVGNPGPALTANSN